MRTSGTLKPDTIASSSLSAWKRSLSSSARLSLGSSGSPRHGAAAARDTPILVQRLQFLQQAIAIVERA